jgi:hypothetical protein
MTRPSLAQLADMHEQVKQIRENRIKRQATRPPQVAAEMARRMREVIEPRRKHLMSEVGLDFVEATAVAHDDAAWYRGQKVEALVKAGEVKAAERVLNPSEKSPSRAQSTVAKISLVRQPAHPPTPELKPGESYGDFKKRIGAHVAQLAQSAGAPAGTSKRLARPADAGRPDVALASEKSEAAYASLRAAELVSHEAMIREVSHRATTGAATTLSESKTIEERAFALMRAKDQSTKPHAKNFAENYAAALRSLEGVK